MSSEEMEEALDGDGKWVRVCIAGDCVMVSPDTLQEMLADSEFGREGTYRAGPLMAWLNPKYQFYLHVNWQLVSHFVWE